MSPTRYSWSLISLGTPTSMAAPLFDEVRSVQAFRPHNLDPEAGEPDIGELAPGDETDRGNTEVFEDLRAEPDLAPLPRARLFRADMAGLRDRMRRHAGGAVAQKHEDAAALSLKA